MFLLTRKKGYAELLLFNNRLGAAVSRREKRANMKFEKSSLFAQVSRFTKVGVGRFLELVFFNFWQIFSKGFNLFLNGLCCSVFWAVWEAVVANVGVLGVAIPGWGVGLLGDGGLGGLALFMGGVVEGAGVS